MHPVIRGPVCAHDHDSWSRQRVSLGQVLHRVRHLQLLADRVAEATIQAVGGST